MIETASAAWYNEAQDNVHDSLVRLWGIVRDENQWQYDGDEYHLGLYAGAVGDLSLSRASRKDYTYGPCTLPYNVVRSGVDTLVAKVAKHRPLPQVLANRGQWSDTKRAKKMSQMLEGQFHQSKIFEKHSKLVVRDAAIFGRGLLYVWHENGKIVVERTYPWEVLSDPWDAEWGDPRTIYRIRSMDRAVAMSRYAKSEAGNERSKLCDVIKHAGRIDNRSTETGRTESVDRVDVLEVWHLPSGEGAGDGRHCIVVQGATLFDEEWKHDFFPFAKMHYNDPVTGDAGQGLAEQLEGYQFDINLMASSVSESYRLLGHTIICVPDDAAVHSTEFRNGIGQFLYHRPGGTPTVFQPAPIHPQVYQRLHDLSLDALADAGISQMSAQSQKPAGIESGIALQTLDDIESERFILFGRNFESWCLDVARLMIAANQEIAETDGELAVSVPMRGGLISLKWADVKLDGFELRVFPTSLLPQQLGARLEKLKMLWDAQLIDRATFMRQLDAPDLSSELDIETADQMLADEQIEYLRDSEEHESAKCAQITPPPEMDYAWVIRRSKQSTCRAQLDGAPEYALQRMRDYTDMAIQLKKLSAPAANDAASPPPVPMDVPPLDPGAAPPMDAGAPPMPPPQPGMAA